MKKALCLLVVCACPVLHALGIPHPEGASAIATNYLMTLED